MDLHEELVQLIRHDGVVVVECPEDTETTMYKTIVQRTTLCESVFPGVLDGERRFFWLEDGAVSCWQHWAGQPAASSFSLASWLAALMFWESSVSLLHPRESKSR